MRGPSLAPALVASLLLAGACQPTAPPQVRPYGCARGEAWCAGKDMAMICVEGRYIGTSCGGPRGCKVEGGLVTCNKVVARPVAAPAEPGDSCVANLTCAADHTTLLGCAGGTLKAKGMCRGPRGCTIVAGAVRCDQSIAEAGDECAGDGAACTPDGMQILECRDGRQAVKSACTAGCEVQRKLVICHSGGLYP